MTPEEEAIQEKREALRKAERDKAKKATSRDEGVGSALGCLVALLMPFVGLAIGLQIGNSIGPQDPNAIADLNGVGTLVLAGIIGFFVGLLVAIAVWLLSRPTPRSRRRSRTRVRL